MTLSSTVQSFPLPDASSPALMQIIDRVRPSIVQVRNARRGAGTGIIWHTDGRIVTNHHVVPRDEATIQVHLSDDRILDAKVIERNPKLDLAVLKISADNLVAASVGDSSRLRVGEWVFAIGHPWGQRGVVTAGIVSIVSSVKLPDSDQETQYIKSDVRLAPGNSGGPLLDACGTVIGINAMILGGDLSVAIPSNAVSNWIAQLPKTPISLGIQIQPVELPADRRQELSTGQGLLVVGIVSGGRAERAGLLVGDVLLNIAGKPLKNVASLRTELSTLAQSEERETVSMNILRGTAVISVDLAVSEPGA